MKQISTVLYTRIADRNQYTDAFLVNRLKEISDRPVGEDYDNFYEWGGMFDNWDLKDVNEFIRDNDLLYIFYYTAVKPREWIDTCMYSDHRGKAPFDISEGYLLVHTVFTGLEGEMLVILINDKEVITVSTDSKLADILL